MSNPLLSIGIIFRDDIRCIERCLKALQPLRDAIPCELVMADTGSKDGSREVAEKYADILIDFPWINDFAAARNAVIDQCSGEWYLTVDTDEYLQQDISELTGFLNGENSCLGDFGTVVIRNHGNYEMDGDFSDFMALRMMRMSAGVRYVGAIHEGLDSPPGGRQVIHSLPNTIFDHDGYVGLGTEAGKAKRERNVKLLRQRMIELPRSLTIRLEMLDSAIGEPDFTDLVRDAVKLIREKPDGWEQVGPSLLRNAIYAADARNLPELDEWMDMAEEWFPDSLFTRIDVGYARFLIAMREKKYDECIAWGERYLKAMEDYHAGVKMEERLYGLYTMASPAQEQGVKISLADTCCNAGRLERAVELLTGLDCARLQPPHVAELFSTLQELQYKSTIDTAPLITEIWEGISAEKPSKRQMEMRLNIFWQVAGLTFMPENQSKEREKEDFCRASYTLYLPLRGKCEVGAAAAIQEEKDSSGMGAALAEVKDWNHFPIHALAYALEQGAQFPLPGKSLNLEEMDSLASRLTQDIKRLLPMVLRAAESCNVQNWQSFVWVRGLLMAAVRTYGWSDKEQKDGQGLALARNFAKIEREFLPHCYAQEALQKDHLFSLPPLHRFGWYCAQAFDALDAGNTAGYVRLLREGLAVCESVKEMVEFLLDHTPELQAPPAPSNELRNLADQIRTILAAYPAGNPAVASIKNSEAYQKVKYLIEGLEVPIVGGLAQ